MRESHPYGDAYTYGNPDRHGDFDAKTDAHAEACADAKSSSHSGAETIEIFAIAKISSMPRRSDAPHYKRECAPIWQAGSPLHADFLTIVLTRFCRLGYKGVPLMEPRECNHTGRNHVATPYSVSTRAPISPEFIQ
jgi:hypothetical protein